METLSEKSEWRRADAVMVVVVLTSVCAMLWPTVITMVELWARNPLGQGYVVIPATLYLVWLQRAKLARVGPAPALSAWGAVAALCFVWLIGSLSNTSVVQQVCLVLVVMATVWAVAGTAVLRILSFPLGLLFFALPLADRMIPALQDATAAFAVMLLRIIGVPVQLEGHFISIPGSRWEVAAACSGINYLVTSAMFGYVYSGMYYKAWRFRLGFFAASVALPLLANGIRVFTTILIASAGYQGIAAGLEHDIYGVIVFALITYVLLATCGGWREDSTPPSIGGAGDKAGWRVQSSTARVALASAGVLGLVAAAPLAARALQVAPGEISLNAGVAQASTQWGKSTRLPFGWRPEFQDQARVISGGYERDKSVVQLSAGYFDASQRDVKLATAENTIVRFPWWVSGERLVNTEIGGRSASVREMVLHSDGAESLRVWLWYWVAGDTTGSDYQAKIMLARARLLRDIEGSALITLATEERFDRNPSDILRQFASTLRVGQLTEVAALEGKRTPRFP